MKLSEVKQRLLMAGVENAVGESLMLFRHFTSIPEYALRLDDPDCSDEAFLDAVACRERREPLQYILGECAFYEEVYRVTPAVLIPRSDTEVLVEEICRRIPRGGSLLDLCTGSGCIGISLKLLNRNYEVTASDLSEAALAVAGKNAASLGANLLFIQSDLFEQVPGRYDMIVSNPPYISVDEIQTLAPEVKEHDPYGALCGGEDGLDFYRRIVKEAKSYLNQKGVLLMEIGCRQAKDVSEMCEACGYTDIRVIKDYAGLDRVVSARMLILK